MAEGGAVNGEGDAWLIQIDNPGRSQLPLEQGTKDPDLPYLRGSGELLPIHIAACRGQTRMVELLYKNTDLGLLEQDDRIYLLVSLIKSDMFAIAMDMINDGGEGLLLLTDKDGETVLSAVAQKFQMLSSSRSSICSFSGSTDVQVKKTIELLDLLRKKLDESQMTTLVGDGWDIAFFAAENGNAEFLCRLIDYYPDLLTRTNKDGHTIFDVAVLHRQKKIFELIDETESSKQYKAMLVANGGNHMLQLAAQLAPSNRLACVPGEVLQPQHELLWFKEVRRLVTPQPARERNLRDDQQTTNDVLFIQNHQKLIKKAEAWVRDMVNPYMFVAALVSAGAYVVPGGTSQNTGYPMFLPDIAYKIFAVAQAISIVSSVASVLAFLSLHMSTYSLENFVREIPIKLLLGLATLFASISSLMVCSVTAFFMYFKQHNLYIKYVVPMALLFCLPPLMFFWLHKGLVFAIIKSTPFTPNHKISTPGANLPQYRTRIDHCV